MAEKLTGLQYADGGLYTVIYEGSSEELKINAKKVQDKHQVDVYPELFILCIEKKKKRYLIADSVFIDNSPYSVIKIRL